MFTFDNSFIKELSILLAKDFSRDNFLNAIGKMYTGILNGDKVGIMTQGSFTDSVIASCNPEFTSPSSPEQETWSLNNFGIYKEFCFDNLLPELKRAQALYDLTQNEAANVWMTEYVEKALVESVIAKAFMASTEAGDNVTAGLDGMNGILTQMLAYVANGKADAAQVVPVATNTRAWGKTGTNAVDVIENLIEAAPAEVKASNNAIIIMTQAMYDCMAYDLKINKGIYVESGWSALFGGLKETTYNGYKLVVIPELDGIITKLQSGDKWYQKPLLAVMTTTDNLLFGSQSSDEAGIAELDIFNDKKTQTTNVIAKYSLGAVVADPKGFSIAY